MGLSADARAAAVALLTDYNATTDKPLQVYPGRPRTLIAPSGFVDKLSGTLLRETALTRHEFSVDIIVLHGLYDSKDTAAQRDAFVDGFLAWAEPRFHQAGGNTISGLTGYEDIPDYVPEWLPPAEQKTYYATRLSLEGSGGI